MTTVNVWVVVSVYVGVKSDFTDSNQTAFIQQNLIQSTEEKTNILNNQNCNNVGKKWYVYGEAHHSQQES